MSKLKEWVNAIGHQELPIFRYTINAINNVVAEDDTSTAELAQVILQDASLTARILRIANSTSYNPTGSPINTISRAIIFVGFNMVRDLSLSLAVIEALLNRKGKEHVFRLMARAFHAAVQARAIAEKRGDDAPEEIFIAALLYYIGEMAFWCVAKEEGDQILELIEQRGFEPQMAQKQVLGFTFEQLTVALTQDWHLSDLLHSAINNPSLNSPRIRDINYSHQLAESTEKSWESKTTRQLIETISDYLEMDSKDAKDWLCENAVSAIEVAKMFGASSISKYLPIPDICDVKETPDYEDNNERYPSLDPMLQLSILRDLSRMLERKPNINVILETILEGIYRGCGMDRTLFAILTPDKKRIRGKYALGEHNQELTEHFQFDLQQEPFFNWLFKQNDATWIKDSQDKNQSHISKEFLEVTAAPAFLAYPLIINSTPIGIVYADRQPSKRELDSDGYESFRHFCLQAKMALEYTSSTKR